MKFKAIKSDCKKFAKCGEQSLAHYRTYRSIDPYCKGCELPKKHTGKWKKDQNGEWLKLCSKCGKFMPVYRFAKLNVVRGDKVYHQVNPECKFCQSDNYKRNKQLKQENEQSDKTHSN